MNNDEPDIDAEVERLTAQLIDRTIDESGKKRLNALMAQNPAACERYLDLMTLHAHLQREFTGEAPVQLPAVHRRPFALQSAGRLRPVLKYAVAAVLLVALGMFVARLMNGQKAESANFAATIEKLDSVGWEPGTRTLQAGERVDVGTISIASGTLVLKFDNGAILTLSGPAELNIESRKAAELRSGRASVRAPQDAVGFTLRTAASDFVDLGTEFGVAVNADHSADVHVFEGVVIARPRASDLVVPVLRDEAGRVEIERGDMVAITSNQSLFPGVAPRPSKPTVPATAASARAQLPAGARVIFLGDRATDNESHLLLINQAMAKALPRQNRPRLFNAGITLPLSYSEEQYRSIVLPLKPTHAVLEFGPEIAVARNARTVEAFEKHVRRLVDRLVADGVEPIIETGFPLGHREANHQPLLDQYNAVLRRIASEKSLRLADVDKQFVLLRPSGAALVADAGAVPTFAGYREIAHALLEALGYPQAEVDQSLEVSLLPGAVCDWWVRGKAASQRLTDQQADALLPDESWKKLMLPQAEDRFLGRLADSTHSITHRDRSRGFATNIYDGPGRIIEGIAYVDSDVEKDVFFNTGATLHGIWLNGERVYIGQGWTGWHAGKERVPARLRAGRNKIVIEAQSSFFVGISDRVDWPLP